MSTKSKTPSPLPRIVEQHSYLSIDFGNNRRLTTSFSGEKASGAVPRSVFTTWLLLFPRDGAKLTARAAQHKLLTDAQRAFLLDLVGRELDNGQRVEAFAAAADKLWPEWKVPPRTFRKDEDVTFDFGPRRGGVDTGTVTEVGRIVRVRWKRMGLVSMAADLLASGGKREA